MSLRRANGQMFQTENEMFRFVSSMRELVVHDRLNDEIIFEYFGLTKEEIECVCAATKTDKPILLQMLLNPRGLVTDTSAESSEE